MKIYTIGFTKSRASSFFGRLQSAGVHKVIDTRLNRVSQLAGFAKQDDLSYFLREIGGIQYSVEEVLAPTSDILDAYRKKAISWKEYERLYLDLLSDRKVEEHVDLMSLDGGCLLCSEATADHCHRRLAAEYMQQAKGNLDIVHL